MRMQPTQASESVFLSDRVELTRQLDVLESRIGYHFIKPRLIIRALTHSSYTPDTQIDNQRLEFLGDRVLGLVMAEAVLKQDRAASEGQLARRFDALVRKEACAEVAREIGLGAFLRLGKSEMFNGGRRKTALLGDAMEAVIAAVYVDGGLDAARAMVLRLWGDRVAAVAKRNARDAKTALQLWAQARGMSLPEYQEIAREGPDHAPVFRIAVRLEGIGREAEGEGRSKRQAEQAAARALINQIRRIESSST